MHTQFHINWIGKQWLINELARLCGLRTSIVTYVDGDRIERSATDRRAVLLSLVKAGYLVRHPGESQYLVTEKVFGAIEAGMAWTSGELLVVNEDGYGLRNIDIHFLKVALVDVREGRATPWKLPNGIVVIRLTAEAQTTDDHKADQWVLDNLPALAHQLLDLSESSAQLVSLRGNTSGVELDDLPLAIAGHIDVCRREINKLRMREEALLMLTMRVERAGGWERFIAECRVIQKLQTLAAEYSVPGKDEATLREAAELFKDEQAGARGEN